MTTAVRGVEAWLGQGLFAPGCCFLWTRGLGKRHCSLWRWWV